MSRDNAYLRDILDSAQAIRRYLEGVTHDQFDADTEKQDAVIRRFEIIGEAARHVSSTSPTSPATGFVLLQSLATAFDVLALFPPSFRSWT